MKTIKLAPKCTVALASQKTLTAQEINAARKRFARVFFVAAFALLISAVLAQAAAEIDLQQPVGVSIADGGSKGFGIVTYGTDKTLTFIVRNTGNAALNLTGNPRVVIGGTHAADFTVTSQPASSLPAAAPGGPVTVLNSGFETPVQGPGGGYTYQPAGASWTFSSGAGIAREGTVWFSGVAAEGSQAGFIAGGDSFSQVLNFPAPGVYVIRFYLIRGRDASPNTIEVRMDGALLGTVLNSVQTDGLWQTFDMQYTCTVAGNHTLAFVGTLTMGGSFASAVDNVQVFPKIYETPFQVRFAPGGGGARTATLSIANDDSDENPYNLTLTGTCPIQPGISIEQPAGVRLTNGAVMAWGCNAYGQTDVPPGLVNVKGIAAGAYHTAVLKADRTVVAWGLSPQATVPLDLSNVVSIAAGERHTLALKNDGTVVAWGQNEKNQSVVPAGLADVAAIAGGWASSAAVRSNGTVVTWGHNLGLQPANLTDVKAVAKGESHTVVLRSNGTVVAWGENFQGEANVPAGLTGVVAIAAGGYGSAAVKSDGTIVQWAASPPEPPGLSGVVALAASPTHRLALRNDATIAAWSYDNINFNHCGQATVPAGLMGVRAVAANGRRAPSTEGHSVALVDSTVDFGNQTVGIPAAKTFTIRNTGLAPLTISGVSVSGGAPANFTVNTSGMLTTVPANGTTIFTVTFTPGSTGDKRTTLRVMNNEPDRGTFYVPLTGTGIPGAPEITVFTGATTNAGAARTNNVGTQVYSSTLVGASSAAQTFTIRNVGTTNLTGLALSKAGANPGDFVLGSLGATTLAPQATTTFTVTFSPTTGGTRSAVVNIASNDGDENPFGINVTGTGIPAVPEIAVFTGASTNAANERVDGVGTYNFPNTSVGNNSAAQTFTIKNIGTAPLTGLALSHLGANPNDFVSGSLGATTLAPQATTTFTVTFSPTTTGIRTAIVRILSNDADEGAFAINVAGTAIAPEIAVFTGATTNAGSARTSNVGTHSFANTAVGSNSAVQAFTVKNIGTANLTGLALTKAGANPGDFAIGSPGSTTLAPQATTTFTVTFAPLAPGARNAVVNLASNDGDESPFRINVSGTATTEASAIVEATLPGDTAIGTSTNSASFTMAPKAIDNDVTTKYLNFDKLNTGLTITPTGHRPVRALTLISAEDAPERDPSSFVLEGSNNGTTFTRIASNSVPAFGGRNVIQSFPLGNTNVFNQYRVLFPTVSNAAAANSMQIAEVELLYHQEITSPNDTLSLTLPPGATDVRGVPTLFDRQLSLLRKFQVSTLGSSNAVVDITPAAGATVLKGFELIGAADDFTYPERRPSRVTVAGSNDGINYSDLATMTPAAPASNLQIQEFATASNTTAFVHYRITFGPPVSGTVLQVGEMRLLGEAAPATLVEASIPGDAITATSLNSPAGYTASEAIDNNVTSKYLNFDKLNTGLTITPTGHRPVRALTLISAEDAPERDPSSFVLEGSNNGTSFTRIASNSVPAFGGRNFIQSFPLGNTNVFNHYRVLFPTVSNAAAANSMQIAEVELLYNQEITSTNDTLSLTLPPGATDVRGVATLFDRQLALLRKFEVGSLGNSNAVVDITPAAGATVLKGFELIGAADDFAFPQRRPSSVTVAASTDGITYTDLATVIPAAPASNLQIQEFTTSSNTTAFAHYRITFGPPVSGTVLQVGEMRLFGETAPVILPPPALSIHASGANVVVSWPNSTGYILESKASLADTTWVPVSVAPLLSNGVSTVTLPMSGATAFFRLHK